MKSALVVVDVQCGLFDDEPRPHDADAVISRINTLSDRARNSSAPVIFVQHEGQNGFLELGSSGWALENQLCVRPNDHVIFKKTPDSFLRTDLYDLISSLGVSRLVICGYATEFCIDTTVRRAAALGYEVVLVADAHTTHDKLHASAEFIRAHHNATLTDLTSFGPKIIGVNTALVKFDACQKCDSC